MDVPRILTANWDHPTSHTLATYRERGGYTALAKALKMTPAEVTQVVLDSGLAKKAPFFFSAERDARTVRL